MDILEVLPNGQLKTGRSLEEGCSSEGNGDAVGTMKTTDFLASLVVLLKFCIRGTH